MHRPEMASQAQPPCVASQPDALVLQSASRLQERPGPHPAHTPPPQSTDVSLASSLWSEQWSYTHVAVVASHAQPFCGSQPAPVPQSASTAHPCPRLASPEGAGPSPPPPASPPARPSPPVQPRGGAVGSGGGDGGLDGVQTVVEAPIGDAG